MNEQIQNQGLTPEMLKNSSLIKCDCGGFLFTEKIIVKKISSLLSPTGRDEVIPLPVMICDKCGKMPSEFDPQNIIPKELKSVKLTIN